ADEILLGGGSPITTVEAVVAVVAHRKVAAFWFGGDIAGNPRHVAPPQRIAVVAGCFQIRNALVSDPADAALTGGFAVDDQSVIPDVQMIARQAGQPLDV